jgi:hypothetical protein
MAACALLLGVLASKFLSQDPTTQPTFAWGNDSDPEQRYDAWVLPAVGDHEQVPALFTAKGVRSPVKLADMTPEGGSLEKGKPYRLLVCLASAGKFAGQPRPFVPQARVEVVAPSPVAMLSQLIGAQRLVEARKLLDALPSAVRERTDIRELAKQVPP